MKKVLVTLIAVCFTLGLTVGVMAAEPEISTSGTIEFKISGTSEEEQASGLFGAGDVLVDYNVSFTSGPWTAVVSPEFDIGGEALAECDAYITYSGEAFTLTLDPTGIDNGIFDIYAYGLDGAIDGAPNIPSNAGLKLEVPFDTSSFYLVVNNQPDPEDSESAAFCFGGGLSTTISDLSLDLAFNSNPITDDAWYGSSYGVKLGYSLEALSLTAEYGAWSPGDDEVWMEEGAGEVKSGSGYYFEMGYTMPGGDTLTLSYTGSDKNLNGAGYGPSAHEYSKIKGVYSHALAEAVALSFEVASTDNGYAEDTITTWSGKLSISF